MPVKEICHTQNRYTTMGVPQQHIRVVHNVYGCHYNRPISYRRQLRQVHNRSGIEIILFMADDRSI